MNRILLADDSSHAQRMGERILREEGYEVVSVTDGETALLRLSDVDPDVIVVDVFLPKRSGLDICRSVKSQPRHAHVRIVLTAGMLETFDEQEARTAGADAILKKPFEASVVLETIRPLIKDAQTGRAARPNQPESAAALPAGTGVSEEELLRAAITVALDAAFPALVEDITAQVLSNLRAVGAPQASRLQPADIPVPVAPLPSDNSN